jgi:hypothetical protein
MFFAQVTKYVEREILNHKQLIHPHIIRFNEVRASAGIVQLAPAPCSTLVLARRMSVCYRSVPFHEENTCSNQSRQVMLIQSLACADAKLD